GKEAWVEPVVDQQSRRITYSVRTDGTPRVEGTVGRKGAHCVVCETAVQFPYIRRFGRTTGMGVVPFAVVGDGRRGRAYVEFATAPEEWTKREPHFLDNSDLPNNPRDFKTPNYGLTTFADLFTPRQLVALTTFSDLVTEARELALQHARDAGLPDD